MKEREFTPEEMKDILEGIIKSNHDMIPRVTKVSKPQTEVPKTQESKNK